MKITILSVIFMVCLLGKVSSRREFTDERIFYRTDSALAEVPDDIPYDSIGVHLEHNKITRLLARVFSHLADCKYLNLKINLISTIEPNAFIGLKYLRNLTLDDNELIEVTADMFNGLGSIQRLTLIDNHILQIRNGTFFHLTNCTYLDLQNNAVENIEKGSFQGLINLQMLNVSDNHLTELKAGMFDGLKALEVFQFNSNGIETINNSSFTGLGNLRELFLFRNMLTELKTNMFLGLGSLNYIQLTFNQINSIENGSFTGLGNATVLKLYDNKLEELRLGMFKGLHSVQDLTLTSNKISSIQDGAFSDLAKLKELFLDRNSLTELRSGMFIGLQSLEVLSIYKNNITLVKDGIFSGLTNVKEIDLDDNSIMEVQDNSFKGLHHLSRLWLSNNRLTTLKSSIFPVIPRPLHLTIGSNPLLQCDSKLCWIKQGEREGWLNWISYENRPLKPQCAKNEEWDNTTMNCPFTGARYNHLCAKKCCFGCSNPGDLTNSVRSPKPWSYPENTQVTYTCNSCYTGGGTITCQSNGQWTQKPECTFVTCADPGEAEHAYKALAAGPYPCGSHVTYHCVSGYDMRGNATLECGNDGHFKVPLFFCERSGATTKQNDSTTTTNQESPDTTDWILIVVGLIIYPATVTSTICFLVFRRRVRENRPLDRGHLNPVSIELQTINPSSDPEDPEPASTSPRDRSSPSSATLQKEQRGSEALQRVFSATISSNFIDHKRTVDSSTQYGYDYINSIASNQAVLDPRERISSQVANEEAVSEEAETDRMEDYMSSWSSVSESIAQGTQAYGTPTEGFSVLQDRIQVPRRNTHRDTHNSAGYPILKDQIQGQSHNGTKVRTNSGLPDLSSDMLKYFSNGDTKVQFHQNLEGNDPDSFRSDHDMDTLPTPPPLPLYTQTTSVSSLPSDYLKHLDVTKKVLDDNNPATFGTNDSDNAQYEGRVAQTMYI